MQTQTYTQTFTQTWIFRWTVIAGLVVFLAGCAAFNYTASDAPQPQAQPESVSPRPRVAVVFSSGGPRGYAHIGVIKALEQAGISPDLIVGTSVGALIGTFWASGLSAQEIQTKALEGGPLTLFDISPFADRGWIRGQRLQDYVNSEIKQPRIEQLPRRMIIVATRRQDKQVQYFQSGNIGLAVRASSAVPGIFSPVGIDGVEYEDGDVSLPLAVQAARQAGAEFVIAVDVSAHEGSAPRETPPAWLARDASRRAKINAQLLFADFLIHPDLGYEASPRRAYFEKSLQLGEIAAQQRMPALRTALTQKLAEFKHPK
jgi:NTE family protein